MKHTSKRKSGRESPKAAQIGASWRDSGNDFSRFFSDRHLERRAKDWRAIHSHYLKALEWGVSEKE